MRTTILMAAMLLAGLGLLAVAPGGMAVGWCTSATDDDCGNYVVCVGKSTNQYGGIDCQYGVPYHCPYDCQGPPP